MLCAPHSTKCCCVSIYFRSIFDLQLVWLIWSQFSSLIRRILNGPFWFSLTSSVNSMECIAIYSLTQSVWLRFGDRDSVEAVGVQLQTVQSTSSSSYNVATWSNRSPPILKESAFRIYLNETKAISRLRRAFSATNSLSLQAKNEPPWCEAVTYRLQAFLLDTTCYYLLPLVQALHSNPGKRCLGNSSNFSIECWKLNGVTC